MDNYSRYAWVFFLADKGGTFGFVRGLILRLKNERHGDALRAIRSDNGSEFKNSRFRNLLALFRSRTLVFFSLCGLLEWCG
jgi:transposase InsO family protein